VNDLSGEVRRLCVAVGFEESGEPAARHRSHRHLVDLVTEAATRAGLDRLYLADHGADLTADHGADLTVGRGADLTVGLGPDLTVGLGPDLTVGRGADLTVGRGADLSAGRGAGRPDPRLPAGAFFLLPPGVNEARVVAGLAGELRLALRRRNQDHGPDAPRRLRLRAAFHQGPTRVADTGFVGRAVDTVHRLRDCAELRAELLRHPGADLAVVLSAQLFEDVIGYEHRDLRRTLFRRVLIPFPDGVGEAWISLPGLADPAEARPYRGVVATRSHAGLFTPPAAGGR
jgi:class 3 adenylate cyclase